MLRLERIPHLSCTPICVFLLGFQYHCPLTLWGWLNILPCAPQNRTLLLENSCSISAVVGMWAPWVRLMGTNQSRWKHGMDAPVVGTSRGTGCFAKAMHTNTHCHTSSSTSKLSLSWAAEEGICKNHWRASLSFKHFSSYFTKIWQPKMADKASECWLFK